jgi:hypothetical protein
MRIVLAALFLSFPILTNPSNVKGQDWRQIVPLKSKRAEVERLLGATSTAYFAEYELKQGSLFIEYSSGPCRIERKGGWNVPRDVVIMVSFTPKHRIRIATLKLDPKKFRRVVDDHVIGIYYYINDAEGITYQVQSGKVDWVEYHPAKRDEHLYCGDPPDEKQRPVKQATILVPNHQ